jgi:hypothetical protein
MLLSSFFFQVQVQVFLVPFSPTNNKYTGCTDDTILYRYFMKETIIIVGRRYDRQVLGSSRQNKSQEVSSVSTVRITCI